MSKLRIIIADDHATVREGLTLLINAQTDMETVGEAGDGRTAVSLALELLPDIVVMDISMPVLNGLKATEEIKRLCPKVKVVALTRHTDSGYLQELLRAGASGYIVKQSVSTELINAIHTVMTGANYLDPVIAGETISRRLSRQTKLKAEESTDLSIREEEILRLIAWGHSNKEIAAKLEISVKTVESHKANTMRKLGLTSRIDIVRFALLKGWLTEN
jgi:two-component system, NarL family, response regulator NreC